MTLRCSLDTSAGARLSVGSAIASITDVLAFFFSTQSVLPPSLRNKAWAVVNAGAGAGAGAAGGTASGAGAGAGAGASSLAAGVSVPALSLPLLGALKSYVVDTSPNEMHIHTHTVALSGPCQRWDATYKMCRDNCAAGEKEGAAEESAELSALLLALPSISRARLSSQALQAVGRLLHMQYHLSVCGWVNYGNARDVANISGTSSSDRSGSGSGSGSSSSEYTVLEHLLGQLKLPSSWNVSASSWVQRIRELSYSTSTPATAAAAAGGGAGLTELGSTFGPCVVSAPVQALIVLLHCLLQRAVACAKFHANTQIHANTQKTVGPGAGTGAQNVDYTECYMQAFASCIEHYCQWFPQKHLQLLEMSPVMAAVAYNDCMYLAHTCLQLTEVYGPSLRNATTANSGGSGSGNGTASAGAFSAPTPARRTAVQYLTCHIPPLRQLGEKLLNVHVQRQLQHVVHVLLRDVHVSPNHSYAGAGARFIGTGTGSGSGSGSEGEQGNADSAADSSSDENSSAAAENEKQEEEQDKDGEGKEFDEYGADKPNNQQKQISGGFGIFRLANAVASGVKSNSNSNSSSGRGLVVGKAVNVAKQLAHGLGLDDDVPFAKNNEERMYDVIQALQAYANQWYMVLSHTVWARVTGNLIETALLHFLYPVLHTDTIDVSCGVAITQLIRVFQSLHVSFSPSQCPLYKYSHIQHLQFGVHVSDRLNDFHSASSAGANTNANATSINVLSEMYTPSWPQLAALLTFLESSLSDIADLLPKGTFHCFTCSEMVALVKVCALGAACYVTVCYVVSAMP